MDTNIQPNLEMIESLRKEKERITKNMVKRQATPEHNLSNKKGIGFTRKNKDQSKKARKAAKLSRKINQKISNKKSRPTGSKKRK